MRYVIALPEVSPLGGVCPVCRGIIDDSGCRLSGDLEVKSAARERTGIARVLEVDCQGTPVVRVLGCPACGEAVS